MQILTYPLAGALRQTIEMPTGAQVLDVLTLGGVPHLSVLVSSMADVAELPREFITVGLGQRLSTAPGRYLGAYSVRDDAFTYHVFEARVL